MPIRSSASLAAPTPTSAWSSAATAASPATPRKVRVFGAWNVADSSGFARTIGTWSLRDNLSLEGSVGWFFGEGDDTISRFADRDFVTVSLKTYF